MKSWMLSVCLLTAISHRCMSQSLTLQTVSSGATYSERIVSTVGQPLIFSAHSTGPNLGSGFAPSITAFSSNFPPGMTYAVESAPIHDGDKLKVTVTDADGVERVTLYRRVIAGSTGTFDSVACVATTNNAYEATILASHYDELGVEYFFTAVDKTGKRTTKLAEDGKYFVRYKDAEGALVPPTVFNIGDKSADYKIITIPFNLQVGGIGNQFNELGEQHASVYRVATYAGNSKWNEYPSPALNLFERGKGYWFLTTKTDAVLFLEGESTPQNKRDQLFEMTLQPEWNQIGNPYPLSINWSDVIEYNDNINIGTLKIFDGGYRDGNELKAFQGGFVHNNSPTPITITIPFKGQTSSGGRSKNQTFGSALDGEQWIVSLGLVSDKITSHVAAIGMHPDASAALDRFDDFHPPRFSNYLEIHFHNEDEDLDKIAKSIVRTQNKFVWQFCVVAPDLNEKRLEWDNTAMGNNAMELYLLDESEMLLVDMRKHSSYAVKKGIDYKIFYGEQIQSEIAPSHPGLAAAYPNPFRADGASDLRIPFGVSVHKGSHATAQVIDAQGRTLRTILSKTLSAGFYEATWDGLDDRGQKCAAGIYSIRLTLADGDTQQTFYNRVLIQ